MAAVAWTAIGLLAAMFAVLTGAFFHLSSKIDSQGRDLRAAIDAQTARIDNLGGRIDAHIQRHAG